MRKVCSISLLGTAAVLLVAGCDRGTTVQRPRTVVATLTVRGREDTQLLSEGLQVQLREYGVEVLSREAATFDDLPAAFKATLESVPTSVVCPSVSLEAGKALADAAYSYSVRSLLVGVDAPVSPRTDHLGPDLADLARRIFAEAAAIRPGVRRIVAVRSGPCLVDASGLMDQLVRVGLEKRLVVERGGPGVTADLRTVLVAVGPDAAKSLVGAQVVVDAGTVGLARVREGRARVALQPNWFLAGVRAARMIAESVDSGWFGPKRGPVPVDRVTKANVETYVTRFQALPPPDPPRVYPDD